MTYVLYKHTAPSGKSYIGITCQLPEKRFGVDGVNYKRSKFFWAAIQKYGWQNIRHEIILYDLSENEAKAKEKEYIRLYKSNIREFGYNLTAGGDGIESYKHTDETKRTISARLTGIHRSDEFKRKVSESQQGEKSYWYGKKQPAEMTALRAKKACKAVICMNNGKVFPSVKDASKYCGLADSTTISKMLKGIFQTAGHDPETNERLKWDYYNTVKEVKTDEQ